MKNLFALVDCDAFFCNCERLFREELRRRPVIVLSNNDGCVVSRTREAKALNIDMAAPYFKIKELCEKNKVTTFSSNFSLYTNISSRVMNTLRELTPILETYSVDEGFLDVSGIKNVFEYGHHIKKTVEKNVGVPVSVGIGPTKGLCKAACFLAKKDLSLNGVVSLEDPLLQDRVLQKMPVEKLWGIGRASNTKLRLLGIKSAKDLRDYKNQAVIQSTLSVVGRKIQDELRGIICFPLNKGREKKKGMMSSRSFGSGVYSKKVLAESLATHVSEVAQELRSQSSVCQEILIYIRSSPFKETSPFYRKSALFRFDNPTNNTFKMIQAALTLLDEIYLPGIEYKKSGVQVFNLFDDHEYNLNLFSPDDNLQEKTLMKTMDHINRREGPRTVQSLACGVNNQEWKMNRNYKSPRFTTSWDELPTFGD